ncbi:MAG: TonB-dependent receptor [Saprospiraceae bacterium]
MRVRGISSITQSNALVVIDGLAGGSLSGIDPNDIATITVLKDGSYQALYGIRASNGVVLVNTKQAAIHPTKLSVSYTGQLGAVTPWSGNLAMDAASFVDAGGYNFGSSTNWQEQILRNGSNAMHHLSVQGSGEQLSYRVSGTYRNTEGVLQKSGFEQLSLRTHLAGKWINDKLKLNVSAAYTDRNSQFGFKEAFHYALSFNPTAPVFAKDAPFALSTTQYGGYFELLGIFDAANPTAIIEQNKHYGGYEQFQGVANISYDLSSSLRANLRYGLQDHADNDLAFYSNNSFFRGYAFSPIDSLKGRADIENSYDQFSLFDFYLQYQKALSKSNIDLTVGTSRTNGKYFTRAFNLTGLEESLGQPDLFNLIDNGFEFAATRVDTSERGWSNQFSAFFGQLHYGQPNRYGIYASVRYEGTDRLGVNNRWGLFPAFGAFMSMKKFWPKADAFRLRAGYGLTGAIPDQSGLYSQKINTRLLNDGTTIDVITRQPNDDLGWEKKAEINIGIDIEKGAVTAYADWFQRKVSDWITQDFSQTAIKYINSGNVLSTTGIEVGIDAALLQTNKITYHQGLRITTFQSKYKAIDQDLLILSSNCCAGRDPFIPALEGGSVGDLVGPIFSGSVNAFGFPVFADLNGDGVLNTDESSYFQGNTDLVTLGNGLPKMELGWWHGLQYGQWGMDLLVRGAFGHSLLHQARQYYEAQTPGSVYNFVSVAPINGLRAGRYMDTYVEKASFLKLDYFTIHRNFQIEALRLPAQISIGVQNVLLFSPYSGIDPEPSLVYHSSIFGQEPLTPSFNPLIAGVDNTYSYRPSTTFLLGLRLNM